MFLNFIILHKSPIEQLVSLGPLVLSSPFEEHLLIEARIVEGGLNSYIQDGAGGQLGAGSVVQEPHELVQDNVGVPHLRVVLLHQARQRGVRLQELCPLLLRHQERLNLGHHLQEYVIMQI